MTWTGGGLGPAERGANLRLMPPVSEQPSTLSVHSIPVRHGKRVPSGPAAGIDPIVCWLAKQESASHAGDVSSRRRRLRSMGMPATARRAKQASR